MDTDGQVNHLRPRAEEAAAILLAMPSSMRDVARGFCCASSSNAPYTCGIIAVLHMRIESYSHRVHFPSSCCER